MTYRRPAILMTFMIFLAACGNQQTKDSQMALMKTTNPHPIVTDKSTNHNSSEIKKDVSSFPDIYDVAVVKGKKDVLVVYKVKHLSRFKMKKIEKQVTNMLENKYPDEDFTVSSDYKIFLETIRLKEKIKADKKFSEQDAEKRLKQLIKMTEEMT
jgi:hypothetical protein